MLLPPLQRVSLRNRPSAILVWFAILLVLLLGMVGLVIDSGLLMASQRHAQNAVDAAATAAATHLFRGDSNEVARAAAEKFVKEHNNLPNATVTVNFSNDISTGPHVGNARYVEVIVEMSYPTHFMQILGAAPGTVRTRAVGGYESLSYGEGAIVLDPNAIDGLYVRGGATLKVNGSVVSNSRGAGYDQYGVWYESGYPSYSGRAENNSNVYARHLQIGGGVNTLANFMNFDPDGPNPIFARAGMAPDPLRDMPVPAAKQLRPEEPLVYDQYKGEAIVKDGQGNLLQEELWGWEVGSGKTATFNPGVYKHIAIRKGATVVFNPGIYILSPDASNLPPLPRDEFPGLIVTGENSITAEGVMFYVTGSNYLDPQGILEPGHWDRSDDDLNSRLDGPLPPTRGADELPPPPDDLSVVTFARATLKPNGGFLKLTGYTDAVYDNISFFQRRRNMHAATIEAKSGPDVQLGGTMYARWARFNLAGGGRFDAQFIVGSLDISGQAELTINGSGQNRGSANVIFLVE